MPRPGKKFTRRGEATLKEDREVSAHNASYGGTRGGPEHEKTEEEIGARKGKRKGIKELLVKSARHHENMKGHWGG